MIGRAFVLTALAFVAVAVGATNDIVEGNPASLVKVTIYADLQCDYCQTFRTMLDDKLLPNYGARVAFIEHDMPLGRHNWARQAAMAARWVHEQSPKLGVVFRRELLNEQGHITPTSLKPWVAEFATRNKLSADGIVAAMSDPRLSAVIDQDIQVATARGIAKLPAVFVAGRSFTEVIVYDEIAKVLDEALSR